MNTSIKKILFFAGLFLSTTSSVLAVTPEKIFQQAEHYTVEIKGSIDKPFVWDSRSSYRATGFVVDRKRGWIITNAHVSGRSPSVLTASFKYGDPFRVVPIYVDPVLDLAILKAPVSKFPKFVTQASLECDHIVQSGHPVGAYGHPYSLKYTATRGIVSGTNVKDDRESLQTDAPINSGNSGGPLISLVSGKVVGINSSKIARSGVEGLNFAIAAPYACRIINLLHEGRDPSPVDLPAAFFEESQAAPPVVAEPSMHLQNNPLHPGDAVVGVVGFPKKISSLYQLQNAMRGASSPVTWRVKRNGKVIKVTFPIHHLPRVQSRTGVYMSGLVISRDTLTAENRPGKHSRLMIHYVDRGAAGSVFNFSPFQYIVSVDGKEFDTAISLYDYLKTLKPEQSVSIKVKSDTFNFMRQFDYYQAKVPLEDLQWIKFGTKKSKGHS
jgi:serine protease Do